MNGSLQRNSDPVHPADPQNLRSFASRSAAMYHSPFHLIDPAILEGGNDPQALKRRLGLEKRKLLAEFELAGTATITLQGHELQRQDISELFDELQNAEKLALQLRLWQHKRFLRFLETGHADGSGEWLYPETDDGDNALLRFVSPYYSEALDRYLQRCLQGREDTQPLLYELRTEYWLLPAHQEPAYRYATRFFTEKKNELLGIRYRSEQKEAVQTSELSGWCSDRQIHVLNRLPDRFDDLRYMLTELLNNLCVLYDRQQAKKHALAAIERAATIRVNDEELEQLIPSNLHIIRNKTGPGLMQADPATGKRRVKFLPIIILLVIIVRLLAAGGGCYRSGSRNQLPVADLSRFEEYSQSTQELSYRALILSLTQQQQYTSSDSIMHAPVQLLRPQKTGDDPFAPLFTDTLTESQARTSTLKAFGKDSSLMLLLNNSTHDAVFLLNIEGRKLRSIYIRPGAAAALPYPASEISVHVYAGRDWDDSLRNSYLHYVTPAYAPRQPFLGGFRTRIPIAGVADSNSSPTFSRMSQTATKDTLELADDAPGQLKIYYNLGED
jgi:hypothetical protein